MGADWWARGLGMGGIVLGAGGSLGYFGDTPTSPSPIVFGVQAAASTAES